MQELFSTMQTSRLYFFCATPDLVLLKNPVDTEAVRLTTGSSTSEASSVLCFDKPWDVLELKKSGVTIGRREEVLHEYAQIFRVGSRGVIGIKRPPFQNHIGKSLNCVEA